MRSAIIAVFLSLVILGVAAATLQTEQAVAQQDSGHGKGKSKDKAPPPPPPRCPDLALATYAFQAAGPDGAPLGPNDIALQWSVNNAGTGPYEGSADSQSLTLEYMSPSGSHQVASTPLPEVPAGTTPAAATSVTLGQGQNWHGVMRVTLPPEAMRRRLRLSIAYVTDGYHAVNDCDIGNNDMDLVR